MTTTTHTGAGTRALALVFLAAIIEGFDLQAAGVAAPKLVPAFKLVPDQVGLFFSAATFGLVFGALCGGVIADRWGRRTGLALSLAAFGLFSIGTAFADTFEHLVAMRFLTGVGLGGALPNLIAIAAESVSPERRGRAVAFMYAGVPLGGALASLVAMVGLHDDWRTIFVVGGILPLLLVVPLQVLMAPFRVVRDARGPARRRDVLLGPSVLAQTVLLWAAFFFGLIVVYLLLNWLPQILVSLGFARETASLVQIVFNIGGAAGAILGGRLLDGTRPALASALGFAGLMLAIALLAMVPAGSVPAALAAGAFIGATVIGVQALLYGIAPQCYPGEVRGVGVGLAVSVGRVGSIVGPLVAGWLLASGMGPQQLLYTLLPIAAVCGAATVILILRRNRTGVPLAA
ncbi:3-(3-hydroxy-phenyl)propionate transporter MhpT [Rhizobium rhizosphaerae]|uniref:3-(3-hydroxy-phenyl)propionate transporter MhpT n=1 Tax=Xaviernesmea rhizosphaerae TaxID=1672749 RepID=A0A1Q9AHI0_9HYPH|nr:3-(3-hydroxy-phenyl)propionate transporter MhpT [Xaviernesmea rhizosphaerae]OLP54688.1 3-(3-hydroxy-phenyl)propionate transporter MhpT [Xaviernesmea rhizosphaerae]